MPGAKRLSGARKVIYSKDPALDQRDPEKLAEGLEHMRKTGERNGLPVREGMSPAIWHIRSLGELAFLELTRTSAHDLRKAADEHRLHSAIVSRAAYGESRDAFRRGLVAIEGATTLDGDPIALGDADFEETPAGRRLKQETLERIYESYGGDLIMELGQQVIEACEVRPRFGSG